MQAVAFLNYQESSLSIGFEDETVQKEASQSSEKVSQDLDGDTNNENDVVYVKGEPVITSGSDVSRFLVDVRDDGDPALTFRSLCIGTVFACLGAALCQIYIFKPVQASVSTVFLLLLSYSVGVAWSKVLPRREFVEGTRFSKFGPVIEFINPGEFRIKEHVIATLVASTASFGNTAVLNFAVQQLYYNTDIKAITGVLATFSTACFGYGLCGILRPLIVYPSEMVYWGSLPTVTIFQSLHFDTAINYKRTKLFWMAFVGMFLWEIIPSYIFPLLNGFSVFCLASQHASPDVQSIFTNLFGGADGNEGLGLLSISFDWQYITSTFVSLPLIQQGNSWVGYGLCYIILSTIYYSNAWNSKNFPILSTSIFFSNGSVYDQSSVFGTTFQLNRTALSEVGLPHLTGSNVWVNITNNLAIGGLFAHCVCFWGPYFRETFRNACSRRQQDLHWKVMQKYKEVPFWWYLCLLVLSFVSGLVVVCKGKTTLSWYSYIVALMLGSFVTPFSLTLVGRVGNGIATNQLMKMVGGAIAPGRPVANLYFTMWSHDIIVQSYGLANDLKIGQYLKVPPRAMFLTQLWGTALGAVVNYGGFSFSAWMASGVTSTVTSTVLVGIISQVWLRSYHPGWFKKYNYILGGALDGGAQVMIFILSFAVFGASGVPRPFPSWAGNPARGNVDYCNGNKPLS